MSKSSRNQPVAFPSDAPVIEAESPVDASEAPEAPESGLEPFPNAPEAVSEAPFVPQKVESMSSQHELAQHIAELLAEEGAEMATKPEVEEESDVDIEAELNAMATSGAILLPDGSMRISVIVPEEQVEIIRSWAEGAGESFESYLQTTVELGLNAVINGGSVAG
jgi:hypothetical protein